MRSEVKTEYGRQELKDSKAGDEPQPQDGQNDSFLSNIQSCNQVEQWLLNNVPCLQKQDVDKYCECFVAEGFDSAKMLEVVEEEDLHFMKKSHKRTLLKMLTQMKLQ